MEVICVDSIVWNQLMNKLESMQAKIDSLSTSKPTPPSRTEWISLDEFYEIYKVSRGSWYDKYRYIIQHRDDGKIWVYKPSMEQHLMDKSINKI